MANEIKITSLNSIGNVTNDTLTAVVDMVGTPTTKKATIQTLGNFILNNAGTSNMAPAGLANIAYSVANAAQPNITSVGTLTLLNVNGNITSDTGIFIGNGSGLTQLTGSNISGEVANAAYANTAGTAGTVTTAEQSNITSVGTLTALSVTGNISAGNVSATNGLFTNISGNGSQLTNLSPTNLDKMPSAYTLLVDPDGSDITGDGSVNKPFASVQAAHNYAANNIVSTAYIAIKLNAGNYVGNVTLTRPKTIIVGSSEGQLRSSWITGTVTVNMTSGATVLSSDVFALQDLIITANDALAVSLAGDQRYVFFGRNVYLYSSGTSADVFSVTNTSSGGIKVDLFNCYFQSAGTGTTASFTNTYYVNINSSTLEANNGPALSLTTSSGLIGTTRISTISGSNTVVVNSTFAPGSAMTFGVCTFESTATNGNGIYIGAGATAALGGCAFNVPTGSGFAVAGAAGSFLVKSANNNQIAYNTNGNTQGTVTVVPMVYL
jgi:hypothetical protein